MLHSGCVKLHQKFRDFVGLPMGLLREESPKNRMNTGLFGSRSGSTVSKQLVEHHSSLNVNLEQCGCGKDEVFSSSFSKIQTSETLCFWGFLSVYIESPPVSAYNKRQCVKK